MTNAKTISIKLLPPNALPVELMGAPTYCPVAGL